MNKPLIIGGTITVVGLVLLYFYYKSRATVAKGVNYDLENADIWGISSSSTQAPAATTAATAAPRYAVDSYTEPAASLIAQQVDIFLKNPSTMNRIKERIGWNSNLFSGLTTAESAKIKNAFRVKFDINPDSMLSYPLWTPDVSPTLLPTLQSKAAASWERMRGSDKIDFLRVTPWQIDFSNYSFNYALVDDYRSLKRFYENAVFNIKTLQDAVRYEAVQYLRKQGWRFTDYGDTNN